MGVYSWFSKRKKDFADMFVPKKNAANLNDFRHIRTAHPFHIVDPSPWPFVASMGSLMFAYGMVMYMHRYEGGFSLLRLGLAVIIYVMFTWWRDIVREATFEDMHTIKVQKGLRLGVALFIVSEAMFFFSFFWAFFHSSLSPVFNIGGVWPPKAISTLNTFGLPFTNTLLLLTSGASVTWAHHAVLLRAKRHSVVGLCFTILFAFLFMCLQYYEYRTAPFNMSDGIYGSCFYMTTGLHGFHVFAGTVALIVALFRLGYNHFTNTHHVGLESAIWYWHFVDIVWLILFVSIYWWGNM
jgi:heme/copper-type cytochrome/quinol oxidase subunit 3